MRQGPKTRIKTALRRVSSSISRQTDPDNLYSRGLSREGYEGGYEQALMDVLLVLGGTKPNTRRYWDDWNDEE